MMILIVFGRLGMIVMMGVMLVAILLRTIVVDGGVRRKPRKIRRNWYGIVYRFMRVCHVKQTATSIMDHDARKCNLMAALM